MNRKMGLAITIALAALAVAACGDDSASGVTVSDAWARNSASTQSAGAVYFTVTSGDDGDTLLGASVSASVAADAQVHETVEVDMSTTTMGDEMSGTTMGDEMSGTTMGGMTGMSMQEVDSVAIPSNGSVGFEPGGHHVMLMNLAAPLAVGETFDLTLTFEKAGDIIVTVEVRES